MNTYVGVSFFDLEDLLYFTLILFALVSVKVNRLTENWPITKFWVLGQSGSVLKRRDFSRAVNIPTLRDGFKQTY
jgi:hypothetical protein